ncbi:uncharacterized protein LOC113359047 [Papaver somniferum]|uniref:uncharacterized protein LOC113359047 n=1 Tax=Papaver somniferum TaxID=3469 RepID=UPI000E6FB5EF|nr:uncharacterized protein LOC113359047 [Papaver somniferum]
MQTDQENQHAIVIEENQVVVLNASQQEEANEVAEGEGKNVEQDLLGNRLADTTTQMESQISIGCNNQGMLQVNISRGRDKDNSYLRHGKRLRMDQGESSNRGKSSSQPLENFTQYPTNILKYTAIHNIREENQSGEILGEKIDRNLLRNYLDMSGFDVSFDDYNAQNIDPANFHQSGAFKGHIEALISQYEQNQTIQNSSNQHEIYTSNTHVIIDDPNCTPNLYPPYQGTISEQNYARRFKEKAPSAADQEGSKASREDSSMEG